MTNSEKVEKVAREVLGCEPRVLPDAILIPTEAGYVLFDPYSDANDLMMVLEKFDGYLIYKMVDGQCSCSLFKKTSKCPLPIETMSFSIADTLVDAVLDAAIKAVEK